MTGVEAHNQEIRKNLEHWRRKPVLREIYKGFHQTIATYLTEGSSSRRVELGSGVADIRAVIPNCMRTDIFPNPWIDRTENAYHLSFDDKSVSDLILFDVFHHLRYPGSALKEFHRVLEKRGRVIIFEPCLSLLGLVVYGLLHQEPLGLGQRIQWEAPADWNPENLDYYAAQGNATRIFLRGEVDVQALGWKMIIAKRLCSVSYVASGGYSKLQLYPGWALPAMRGIDKILGSMPQLFSARVLIVLEKR